MSPSIEADMQRVAAMKSELIAALNGATPLPLKCESVDRGISVTFDGYHCGIAGFEEVVLQSGTLTQMDIESAVDGVLEFVQDCLMEGTRLEWPTSDGRTGTAIARIEGEILVSGYK